ncbi:MAG: domain S-box-containing protein, partial [Chitinophagaceae bacterium]|nr:domain S-box-containing protein [Chitinophagaceae bacterium]
MKTPLKILLLEDNGTDAEIIRRFLLKEKQFIEFRHVLNRQSFLQALDQFKPDIILSDHALPQFNSTEALSIARGRFPDIPFIMITGTVSEEFAAEIIKSGADDYILKDRINRLPLAMDNALYQRKIKKEKQEALEKLIQSEEKYRTIFFKSPLPKWIYDLETLRFLEVNEAAILHYGYSQEEFLSMTIKDIRPKEEITHLLNDLKEIEKFPDTRQSNWTHRKKNGDLIIVETTAHSIAYNNARARMVLANDITEKTVAVEKLSQSEEKYRTIMERLSDGFAAFDKNWRFTYVNKAAGGIINRKPAELIGKNIWTEFPESINRPFYSAFYRAMEEQRYIHLEEYYPPLDIWLDNHIYPSPDGLSVFFRDITQSKKSEKELQAAHERLSFHVENTPLGFIEWDNKLRVKHWSDRAVEIFGWTQEEFSSMQKNGYTQVFEEDLPWVNKITQQLISGQTERNSIQHRNYTKDGRVIWCEWFNSVLKDIDGNVVTILSLVQDITERKNAEEDLRQSEIRLKEAQAIAHISNWEIDLLQDVHTWSDEFYRIYGLSKGVDQPSQELFQTLIHPDDLDFVQKKMQDASRTFINSSFNFRFIRKDGVIRFGYSEWKFDFDAKGKPLRLFGILQDITERKQAEDELKKSEEKYKTLIQRIRDAFISLDKNWCYTYLNKQAGELIHRDPADLVGKNFWAELPDMVGTSTYYAFHKALAGQEYTCNVDYYPPFDLWLENHIYPSEDGLSVFMRDITEKKKTEEDIKKSNERFEMVVSATNDVIWDWNMENDEFWWNENYYSYFGYEKQSTTPDIISWYEGFHPDDKERVLAGIHSSIKNKQDFWTDEYRFLKADGTVAFVLDCAYILYTEKKEPYRMVGAMLDITHRKKAEEEVKKSFTEKETLAERLSTILNTLPANIALLDEKGYVIDINDAWRNHTGSNEFIGSNYGVGDNYMNISKISLGHDKTDGKVVAKGISDVLDNKTKEFIFEYAGGAPGLKRWFRMVATSLQGKEYAGAVVMHMDISEIRRLEQERLETKTEEQKKITKAMLQAQEQERNSIGLELHDNVNQILAVTIMQLSMVKNNPERVLELVS